MNYKSLLGWAVAICAVMVLLIWVIALVIAPVAIVKLCIIYLLGLAA